MDELAYEDVKVGDYVLVTLPHREQGARYRVDGKLHGGLRLREVDVRGDLGKPEFIAREDLRDLRRSQEPSA